MKHRDNVIFLIDSDLFDRNMLGLTLEKVTKCKVFNFFSIEECLLYWKLNPTLVIYDTDLDDEIYLKLRDKVNFINISEDILKVNNSLGIKDTSIAQEVAAMMHHAIS